MSRAIAVAALVLAACSSNGTGGGTGGAGGSGGSGGADGGSVDAGSFRILIDPTTTAAIAFPEALDASLTVTVPSDGGPQRTAEYGPDGLTFSPPLTAGFRFASNEDDAGFELPLWALRGSDGGLETLEATTFVSEHGAAVVVAAVPHFSTLTQLKNGAHARLGLNGDQAVYDVGERVAVVGEVGVLLGSLASGEVTFEATGALELRPAIQLPVTFTDLRRYTIGFTQMAVFCKAPGLGTLVFKGSLSKYPAATPEGGTQPKQDFALYRQVRCAELWPPERQPAISTAISQPATLPSDGTGSSPLGIAAALMLRDWVAPPKVDDTVLKVDIVTQCGRGTLPPCRSNPEGPGPGLAHSLRVTITNISAAPVHFRPFTDLGFGFPIYVSSLGAHIPADLAPPATLAPNAAHSENLTFFCQREGRGAVTLEANATFEVNDRRVYFFGHPRIERARIALGQIQCGGTGDAVMLSDNTRLTRTGNTWNAMATGVAANLIVPAPELASKFGALTSETVGLDGVAQFTGRVGAVPRFRFVSGRQTATWNHTGTGYSQTGLVAGAAYNATDALTVTGLALDGGTASFPDGGPAVVTLPAPPVLPAAAQLFGAREGLRTRVRLPDGTFDVLYVSTTTASPAGGTGGIFRTVRAADMELDAGVREAPMMDEPAMRALAAWGLDAGVVYIAAYRQQTVEGFFTEADGGARPVPVQAGRMVQVNVADLAP